MNHVQGVQELIDIVIVAEYRWIACEASIQKSVDEWMIAELPFLRPGVP